MSKFDHQINIVGLLMVATVVGCSYGQPVTTSEQAISVGLRACDESWGKQIRINGGTFPFDAKIWHARLEGDHWKVWTGSDEANPGMLINVLANGRSPDGEKECDMIFLAD